MLRSFYIIYSFVTILHTFMRLFNHKTEKTSIHVFMSITLIIWEIMFSIWFYNVSWLEYFIFSFYPFNLRGLRVSFLLLLEWKLITNRLHFKVSMWFSWHCFFFETWVMKELGRSKIFKYEQEERRTGNYRRRLSWTIILDPQ